MTTLVLASCQRPVAPPPAAPLSTVPCGDPDAGPRMAEEARARGLDAAVIPEHGSVQLAGTIVTVQQVIVDRYVDSGQTAQVGPRAYLIVTYGEQGLVHTGLHLSIR